MEILKMKDAHKIEAFKNDMLNELLANQHKGNWNEFKDINNILLELEWHKAKLLMALREGNPDEIREYIADTSNCLLFLGNALDLY